MSLFSRTPAVDARRAAELVQSGAVLLDVRERGEWDAGHAPMARHLPLGRLQAEASRLPNDRTIVVVCRSGNRSAQATKALNAAGWTALNLSGGMHAWQRAGGPIVGRGGRPGFVA
jgi:rhodanese-related sulfurtransferase